MSGDTVGWERAPQNAEECHGKILFPTFQQGLDIANSRNPAPGHRLVCAWLNLLSSSGRFTTVDFRENIAAGTQIGTQKQVNPTRTKRNRGARKALDLQGFAR